MGAMITSSTVRHFLYLPILALVAVVTAGCASDRQPSTTTNLCEIFDERPHWYKAARKSEKRWGAPVHLQMAIMWRESAFRPKVKAPRKHVLWVIPWGRQSTSRGFTQAVDGTWDWYIKASGNRGANRSNFADSADFVGWYVAQTRKFNNVPVTDPYRNYLAYHEGHGGYKKGTYKKKPQVRKAARQVEEMASRYKRQLRSCSKDDDGGLFSFF